jgi:hypothetical protein
MKAQDRINQGAEMALRQHTRAVAETPGGEFHCSVQLRDDAAGDGLAFVDIQSQTLIALNHAGVFERERRVRPADNSGPSISVWTCPREYRERAQEMVEGRDSPIGCGHTGIRNKEGGGYTCLNDDCDREVEREEVDL